MEIYELYARFDCRKSFYGKAIIMETKNKITLQSYDTKILEFDKNTHKLKLVCKDKEAYTQTTNRHINEFIKQFTNETPKTKKEILKMAEAK